MFDLDSTKLAEVGGARIETGPRPVFEAKDVEGALSSFRIELILERNWRA